MKKRMVKLMVGLVLIGISIVYLNAVIVFNDPYSPFPAQTSIQVGDMITDSASELLQSASEAFLFLNEVEIAGKNGLNVGSALQRVDMAAARVEQALNLFKNIIAVGSEAGYEKNRIGKLMDFSYGQFARDNGLSEETMNEVSAYLAKGNVLGFYRRHARNLQKLLNTLQLIKTDLLAGKLSENQVLWSLLQQYNSTMMFGNYASLVFYKI
ncbi:MAG: hypothetical protein KJ808_04290 [Acidobacteria bacterium]|nr:hypothetical protein [Acidobacteriota bacterium]MBU4306379.1 hypothetical protein [Acidobacteriota bacterium]MCG2810169.1 hypothetical protein [Candidatus Aminicenantes bacterium]